MYCCVIAMHISTLKSSFLWGICKTLHRPGTPMEHPGIPLIDPWADLEPSESPPNTKTRQKKLKKTQSGICKQNSLAS